MQKLYNIFWGDVVFDSVSMTYGDEDNKDIIFDQIYFENKYFRTFLLKVWNSRSEMHI